MSGQINETIFTELKNTGDLERLFHRSAQTITVWRKTKGLPFIRIKGDIRDSLRFDLPAVLEWAKANRIETFEDGLNVPTNN